jgi:hypothetical protein
MTEARRLVVLRARGGLTVTVLYDEIECIVARLETSIEHTLWSFLGCGREKRIPVVRVNAWTVHGGPFTTTIEVDDEEDGSELLQSIMAQIPHLLQEADEDDGAAPQEEAPEDDGAPQDEPERNEAAPEDDDEGPEESEDEEERPEPAKE